MRPFLALGAFLMALPNAGQGRIILENASLPNPSGGLYDAPITLTVGELDLEGNLLRTYYRGLGSGFSAGLFLEGSETPLVTTEFVTEFGPEYYWMFREPREVQVPGTAPGQTARLFVGAWRTSDGSFANSRATGMSGMSAVFTSAPLGGPNPAPGEPPFITPSTTFQGFWMGPLSSPAVFEIVPEPTGISLFFFGAALTLAVRRRTLSSVS